MIQKLCQKKELRWNASSEGVGARVGVCEAAYRAQTPISAQIGLGFASQMVHILRRTLTFWNRCCPTDTAHLKTKHFRGDRSGPKYWARQIGVFFEEYPLFCKSWCPSFCGFGRFVILFEQYMQFHVFSLYFHCIFIVFSLYFHCIFMSGRCLAA